MGHYCCCGQRTRDKCLCKWEGWHNLEEDETDLPKEDGKYLVRYFDDGCEKYEVECGFSIIPKKWDAYNDAFQWEVAMDDGYSGYAAVYGWMELNTSEYAKEKRKASEGA